MNEGDIFDKDLVRASLANTYARMAINADKYEQNKEKQRKLAAQAIEQASLVLGKEDANPITRSLAFAAIGCAHLSSGDYEASILHLKKAIGENPGNVQNYLELGNAYLKLGQKDDAFISFNSAAKLSPFSGYANYRLGSFYRDIGEIDEAKASLSRAAGFAYAHLVLGKIYLDEGEINNALGEFRKATEINKKLSEAWVNIAWTIYKIDDKSLFKEGELAARRASQLEKNKNQQSHRHSILALLLIKNEKYELALQEAKTAVELNPKQAQAWYAAAITQYNLDQFDQARESALKVMQYDKDKYWLEDTTNLLRMINRAIADDKNMA